MEPQTDAERVEWLWAKLDRLNADNASLQAALHAAEHDAERSRIDATDAREQMMQLAAEVSRMAVELNAARQSAASAVREHIKVSGGR